jgi:hypothetical protein
MSVADLLNIIDIATRPEIPYCQSRMLQHKPATRLWQMDEI